jgi:nitroreductase / dihydropteridine reductase
MIVSLNRQKVQSGLEERNMEFEEIVKQRYAAKQFTSIKIPEEQIRKLIELIRLAPSALNLQPWRIKVIGDEKARAALATAVFGQHAIACSHLIILCANTDIDDVITKADKSMREAGFPDERRNGMIAMAKNFKDRFNTAWSQQQVFIALANAVNGAKALGFDSCPMTGFDPAALSKALDLPAHIVPTALCPVGYAADTPIPKARLSLTDLML